MRNFEILLNDTLELLKQYARENNYTYPNDIGAWVVKAHIEYAMRANGQKPTQLVVEQLAEVVEAELVAIQFETRGKGEPLGIKRKVHITDSADMLLYTRLWDDGTPVLAFDSGYGFIDRYDCKQHHWQIKPGWPNVKST